MFLWHIVTVDKKLVFYDNPESKRSWIDNISISQYKSRRFTARRFFFAYGGIARELFITSCSTLKKLSTLNITVINWSNWGRKINELQSSSCHSLKKIVLLHDNANPCIRKVMKDTIFSLRWKVLPHPAHSPDRAPSCILQSLYSITSIDSISITNLYIILENRICSIWPQTYVPTQYVP